MITLIPTRKLAYIVEQLKIILWILFHIQPLRIFVHVAIGNKKYANCKSCGHQRANSAPLMPVHYTSCSTDSVSSASIERLFSNLGNVHTEECNRLGNSKAYKLVFCYRIIRSSYKLDYWLFRWTICTIFLVFMYTLMCQILNSVLIKINVYERHYRINVLDNIH